jgi:hypothetical protein
MLVCRLLFFVMVGTSPAFAQDRPAARACHSAAAVRAGIAVWGGASACGVRVLPDSALWLWDGSAWQKRAGPPIEPREDALLLFNPADSSLAILGGRRDGRAFADLWRWNGRRWAAWSAGGGPGAIQHGAAAFDPRRQRIVVFGGAVGRTFSTQTFEWDGARWHTFDVPGPAARVGHGMAWSHADGGVVLYGGFRAQQFRDLWKWDGTRWQRLADNGPTFSEGHVIAASDSGVFVVGPGIENAATVRVWHWRRGAFTPLGTGGPPVRIGATAVYDRTRRVLVYWGGSDPAGTASAIVHEFDGGQWRMRR